MRIGILAGAARDDLGLEGLIDQVVLAERDGLHQFWLPHLSSSGYDAINALTLAATRTERIELATGVVPTFPRHPMALAQQALTAQVVAQGRFTLGIGPSHRPGIEDTMGLSYDRPAAHVREYLSVLRPLLSRGRVDFEGDFYRVKANLSVPGASDVPVVVAALAPRMLRIAGQMADGTITWMAGIRTVQTHIVPRITASAAEADRPDPRICVALPVAVVNDVDQAYERAASTYGGYGSLINYRRLLDIEGADSPADVAIIGSEAEVEDKIRAFDQAGTTDFIASIMPGDEDTFQRTWELLTRLAD